MFKKATNHEWVCLLSTEKNDCATYFSNAPRTVEDIVSIVQISS